VSTEGARKRICMVDKLTSLLIAHSLFADQSTSHYLFSNYESENWELLPEFGYKIHISATTSNFERILQNFFKYSASHPDVLFKVVSDVDKLNKQNMGFFGLSQVGKFITIYPKSDAELLTLLIELELIYKFDRSIRVPSDKRFLNSEVVYYRYGEFKFSSSHNDKRTNNELFYDKFTFTKYSQLPDHYAVVDIIQKSGNNGVYSVLDTSLKRIKILKESVPFGAISKNNVDSINRKIDEFFILKEIDEAFVPKVVDIFWLENSLCMVMDNVVGTKMGDIVISSMKFGERMVIFLDLVKKVAIMHQKYDIVINDISMNNVIVDSENKVNIIDFEMSHWSRSIYDSEEIGTMGFYDREYQGVDFSQDIFSLGKILFYLLAPEQYAKDILKKPTSDISDFVERSVFDSIIGKTNNHDYNATIDLYKDLKEVCGEQNFKVYIFEL
jgi:hypothetical protein